LYRRHFSTLGLRKRFLLVSFLPVLKYGDLGRVCADVLVILVVFFARRRRRRDRNRERAGKKPATEENGFEAQGTETQRK